MNNQGDTSPGIMKVGLDAMQRVGLTSWAGVTRKWGLLHTCKSIVVTSGDLGVADESISVVSYIVTICYHGCSLYHRLW